MLRHPSHALSNIVDMHTLSKLQYPCTDTRPRTDVHRGTNSHTRRHTFTKASGKSHTRPHQHTQIRMQGKCSMHDLFALIYMKIEYMINKQILATESIQVQILMCIIWNGSAWIISGKKKLHLTSVVTVSIMCRGQNTQNRKKNCVNRRVKGPQHV